MERSAAFVAHIDDQEVPVDQCYLCWTVFLPDGRALSVDELNRLEAERIAAVKKKGARELASKYGWLPSKAERLAAGKVEIGDEVNAVRAAWGSPARAERTTSPKGGIVETWTWDDGRAVSFKDGVATAVMAP